MITDSINDLIMKYKVIALGETRRERKLRKAGETESAQFIAGYISALEMTIEDLQALKQAEQTSAKIFNNPEYTGNREKGLHHHELD